MSGDNGRENYNEPVAMRNYLVSAGIPAEAIALDYAGFDIYDTCVQAHRIFGVTRAIIIFVNAWDAERGQVFSLLHEFRSCASTTP